MCCNPTNSRSRSVRVCTPLYPAQAVDMACTIKYSQSSGPKFAIGSFPKGCFRTKKVWCDSSTATPCCIRQRSHASYRLWHSCCINCVIGLHIGLRWAPPTFVASKVCGPSTAMGAPKSECRGQAVGFLQEFTGSHLHVASVLHVRSLCVADEIMGVWAWSGLSMFACGAQRNKRLMRLVNLDFHASRRAASPAGSTVR